MSGEKLDLPDRRRPSDGARRAGLGAGPGLRRRGGRDGRQPGAGPGGAGTRARDRRAAARSRHAGHGRADRPGPAALRPSDRADHRRLGGARGGRDPARLRVRRLGLYRQVGVAGGDRRHGPRRAGRRDLRAAGGHARRFLRPARRPAHAAAMARAGADGPGRPEQADRLQARRRRSHREGARHGDPAQARRALAHPGRDRGARPRDPAASRSGLNPHRSGRHADRSRLASAACRAGFVSCM